MNVEQEAVNPFTVDLEEWFHVCGAGSELASEHWDQLPSRVELTTQRLLDLLDRVQVTATFFVLGWVAERHPRLIEDVKRAGHTIGSTDDIGDSAVECVHHVRDVHVTILRLLGLDDAKLTYFHAGRFKQLSQFGGEVIKELLA